MAATNGTTLANEQAWCVLRAEGKQYQAIAEEYNTTPENVRQALRKPANVARINRITAELEEAAISAARHNVAAAVSEKCRLRLAYARNLGIDSEESIPRVGIDSSVLTRDYLAVDKALLEHLESYAKRRRETNQDERTDEAHELEIRRAKILLEIAEQQKHGDGISGSVQNGGAVSNGDATLPDNRRTY